MNHLKLKHLLQSSEMSPANKRDVYAVLNIGELAPFREDSV